MATEVSGGTAGGADTVLAALAAERDLLVGIGPFVLGLLITGALIGAVWLGIRIRRREPPPPRPEDQPHLPPGGPVKEIQEHRRPAVFRRGQRRRYPHELHPYGTVSPDDPDAAPPDEPPPGDPRKPEGPRR